MFRVPWLQLIGLRIARVEDACLGKHDKERMS